MSKPIKITLTKSGRIQAKCAADLIEFLKNDLGSWEYAMVKEHPDDNAEWILTNGGVSLHIIEPDVFWITLDGCKVEYLSFRRRLDKHEVATAMMKALDEKHRLAAPSMPDHIWAERAKA